MSSEYDDITAFHYASYRPALHTYILEKCFDALSFDKGLDIGCGTGQSSIALSAFCNSVVGIDPSTDMISKGIPDPNIIYQLFNKSHIDFENDTFEVITMAGSLWYAKSQQLLDEIVRVSTKNGTIVLYDFEILLEDVLHEIGFVEYSQNSNCYNHEEDFSGLDVKKVSEPIKNQEEVSIQIHNEALAHLILSIKKQYDFLANLYGTSNLHKTIVQSLNLSLTSGYINMSAKVFSSVYHIR